jgi:hypothetical protein
MFPRLSGSAHAERFVTPDVVPGRSGAAGWRDDTATDGRGAGVFIEHLSDRSRVAAE